MAKVPLPHGDHQAQTAVELVYELEEICRDHRNDPRVGSASFKNTFRDAGRSRGTGK
jgi:hypothetical protein